MLLETLWAVLTMPPATGGNNPDPPENPERNVKRKWGVFSGVELVWFTRARYVEWAKMSGTKYGSQLN